MNLRELIESSGNGNVAGRAAADTGLDSEGIGAAVRILSVAVRCRSLRRWLRIG